MKKIVIVGAGITGLTSAWLLHKKYPNSEITILEASDSPGGLISTQKKESFIFDLGPKGFLVRNQGLYTLKLIQDLGLNQSLIFNNSDAKKRYIHFNGKTRKLSLSLLLKQGILSSLIKDLFAKPGTTDETVEQFLLRHCSAKLTHNILIPAITAFKAGHSNILSAEMALETLFAKEKQYKSLLRYFFKEQLLNKKRSSQQPYLASLKDGMGSLIQALHQQLPSKFMFHTPVTKIICHQNFAKVLSNNQSFHADMLVFTAPLSKLQQILYPSIPQLSDLNSTIQYWNLSCVSLGWNQSNIITKKGYGLLVADAPPLLGIVWNSNVFPQQNKNNSCISLLLQGSWSKESAYSTSLEITKKYLNINVPPHAISVNETHNVLPQHGVGIIPYRTSLLLNLPPYMSILGQNLYGPGLNKCIASVYEKFSN